MELVNKYIAAPIKPEINGDTSQEATIPPRPLYHQSMQSVPTSVIVIPTTPPTIAWVVDTGILKKVAVNKNSAADIKAPSIPIEYTPIAELQ